ncbi:hypothetical protein Pelo_19186 [Pelomyxa schiedti]|nr:hypothetical protein Pelo_19186 [Pelomyxa schiedti]
MVDRFDIREPWEFVVPLVGAASGGHIEVMQWIVDTYPDVVPAIRKHEAWVEIHKGACKSGDLAVIKWCSVTFSMPYSFGWFLRYFDWTPAESAEVRQYLNDHSPPPADYTPGSIFFGSVYTVERLKWVGSERLGVVFNEDDLQYICQVSKWNDVAKWVVEEHHVRPTPATFSSACTNYHGNVQLVQWLAPQVHLSYDDLFACFIDSLANNQLEIASGLNNSFHILSQAASTPDSILARVCRKRVHGEKVEAVKWLLDHTALAKVEETLWIEDSVLELLSSIQSLKNQSAVSS